MRIEVTAEDIERGAAGNCLACPVARAIFRLTDKAIAVLPDSFYRNGIKPIRRPLPAAVRAFIQRFDALRCGCPPLYFAPFSFDLPDELLAG